jgi:ketosteroid isomerase-like protein
VGVSGAGAHPPAEVDEAARRYCEIRARTEEGLEPDAFGALADLYTEDAVYVDAAWGRIEGRTAIAEWLTHSMVGLGDWRFPVEFVAVAGDDVVVKWTQVIPGTRPDGSAYTQSGYSRLRYAGGGKFSYEEDVYNMVHVLEDLAQSGWKPTEPMNVPPEHPNRDWSLPG